LLWRVQLVFWPFYLGFAIYLFVRRDTAVKWTHLSLIAACVGLSLSPVMGRGFSLYRHAPEHVGADLPSLRALCYSLKLGLVASLTGIAWLAGRIPGWRNAGRKSVTLMLVWWLCQPVGLFAFSYMTHESVFVTRYLWLSLPGTVLCALALAGRVIPAGYW